MSEGAIVSFTAFYAEIRARAERHAPVEAHVLVTHDDEINSDFPELRDEVNRHLAAEGFKTNLPVDDAGVLDASIVIEILALIN